MNFSRCTTALPVFLLLMFGCGGGPTVVSIKGVATRHGQPVKYVFLTFYPEEGKRSSSGLTDGEGRFELSYDRDHQGASLGKHKVVAIFRPRSPQEEFDLASGKIKLHPEQDVIQEKYGKKETTPLTVHITKADPDLQLHLD